MKAEKKRRSGFAGFLLIYALLVLCALTVALRLGWQFLSDYEASQPEAFMDSYLETLDRERIRSILGVEELPEETVALLDSGPLRYQKAANQSYSKRLSYDLLLGTEKRGLVVIEKDENPNFYTFAPWRLVSESLDLLPPPLVSASVTVPESWSVRYGGETLGESYVVASGLAIPGLEKYYEEGYEVERLKTYSLETSGELEPFEVFDAEGQAAAAFENWADYAPLFEPDIYDNDNEDVQNLVRDYIARYVRYTSNTNRAPWGNLADLKVLIVPGSDLEQRMEDVMEAMAYTNGQGYEIKEIVFNSITILPEGWCADVSYTTDVRGFEGVVTTENHCLITVVELGGRLLVERHQVV